MSISNKLRIIIAIFLWSMAIVSAADESGTTTAIPVMPTVDPMVFVNDEHDLRTKLFTKYDNDMPPFKNSKDNITLQFGLAILKVVDLDEAKHTFTVDGWLKMGWVDFRLAWNSTEKKVDVMNVSPNKVWRPDISLYNTGDETFSQHSLSNPLLVYPSGYVLFIPQTRVVATCEMDITRFPYDSHTCTLVYGSWTFSAHQINIVPFEGKSFGVDDTYLGHHAEWSLTAHNGTKNTRYYKCCPDTPYADVTFNFQFSRKSGFFVHVFIAPAATLACLIPFLFTMTNEYGEKYTVGCGIMICLVLLIIMMENFLPAAMVGMPVLTQYYASSFVLVSICLVLNIWTNKMMRCRTREYPNKFMSKVVIDVIGKFLCLNKEVFQVAERNDLQDRIETEMGEDVAPQQTMQKLRPAQLEWMMIGVVLDRFFFLLFLILVIVISVAMLGY